MSTRQIVAGFPNREVAENARLLAVGALAVVHVFNARLNKVREDKLSYLAEHDTPVTDLPNRRLSTTVRA
jgi:hypothetical protein